MDGVYLFFGGEEVVLVIWMVKDGKKIYLLCLGVLLMKIVARREDFSRLAFFGSDNVLRLVNVVLMIVEGII